MVIIMIWVEIIKIKKIDDIRVVDKINKKTVPRLIEWLMSVMTQREERSGQLECVPQVTLNQ